MRVLALLLSTLLLGSSAFALDPGAPPTVQVTVGSDLKTLVFDWDRVPGTRFYQIHYKADANSGFAPLGARIHPPRTRAQVTIPVHLLDWANARYIVSACDAWGCQDSAELAVNSHGLDTIGYVKASNTDADDQFGRGVLLSDDGKTLIVSAAYESSNATGINGDQSNDLSKYSAAVYVYRLVAGRWRQEAYLKGDVNNPDQFFGHGYPFGFRALGVSADGNLLAVGAPGEWLNFQNYVGAVYVFARGSAGAWALVQKLQAPVPQSSDYFGNSVDMSLDGNTLKVTSLMPRDGEGNPEGRHHVYARVNGEFVLERTLAPPNADWFCMAARLSGDGQTLVAGCLDYTSSSPNHVVTRKRNGGSWDVVSDLPGEYFNTNAFALTPSGNRLAIKHDFGLTSEVRTFRWAGAGWASSGAIPEAVHSDGNSWGALLAWDRNGRYLAIGDPLSQVSGVGVANEIQPLAASGSFGAVFLYERTGPGSWAFKRQIKSPVSDAGDVFGIEISMSGNGRTLAVGAIGEDSPATGIDGDQADNSADEAGAVYLY